MAARLTLRVLTPAREVVARQVDTVNLTAVDGEVGILPGHAAFLAELRPGQASYRDGDEVHRLALSDGFLEVKDDVVTALVRAGESADQIDLARAEARRVERVAELARQGLSEQGMRLAELSLQKQLVRLQVGGRPGGMA